MDVDEIWYLSIFRMSVEKIHVSLKSDKNNGYFTWRPIYIFDQFFLEWEMFPTKVTEKIKTHILCSIFFFFLNSAFNPYHTNVENRVSS